MGGGHGGPYSADGFERLAREAGRTVGRTVEQLEITARQVFEAASREARTGAQELHRQAVVVVDGARDELPRLRAEVREMEARVRDRIRKV